MNTRDKILNHLETNIPTSAPQFAKLLGCQKSHINLLLRDLIADGQIEIERISKSVKYYRWHRFITSAQKLLCDIWTITKPEWQLRYQPQQESTSAW